MPYTTKPFAHGSPTTDPPPYVALVLFRLTRPARDVPTTTAAIRRPHDDAHAHAAKEQLAVRRAGSEGGRKLGEAWGKTLATEPTTLAAAGATIPTPTTAPPTNAAWGGVVAGAPDRIRGSDAGDQREPDGDGVGAARAQHAAANDDQNHPGPGAPAAEVRPIAADEDNGKVNDLTKLKAQMVAAQGGANLASVGGGGDDGGGAELQEQPSKAELRKRRLKQLSRLVHKFHTAKREQAQKELTAGHEAVVEVQRNRTKALALISELRTWLRESASIDAAR